MNRNHLKFHFSFFESHFSCRYSFTVFSNILIYCVTWAVLHVTSDDLDAPIGPGDAYKFQYIVFIGMFVGIVASIFFHCGVREGNDNVPAGVTYVHPTQ